MKKNLLLCLVLFCCFHCVKATHILGGYLRVERIPGASLTVRITMIGIRSVESSVPFASAGAEIDFGDNTSEYGPFATEIQLIGENLELVQFSVVHTYPSNDYYRIGFKEANRIANLINVQHSIESEFAVYTEFFLGEQFEETPTLAIDQVVAYNQLQFGQRQEFVIPTTLDNDQFFVFDLTTPRVSKYVPLEGYSFPNARIDRVSGEVSVLVHETDYAVEDSISDNYILLAVRCRLYHLENGEAIPLSEQLIELPLRFLSEDELGDFACKSSLDFDSLPECLDHVDSIALHVALGDCDDQGIKSLTITSDDFRLKGDSIFNRSIKIENDTTLWLELADQEDKLVTFNAQMNNDLWSNNAVFHLRDCEEVSFMRDYLRAALSTDDIQTTLIYPNPTTGAFYIDSKEVALVEVYDLGGNLVLRKATVFNEKIEMNQGSELNPGIYMAMMTNRQTGKKSTQRLAITK